MMMMMMMKKMTNVVVVLCFVVVIAVRVSPVSRILSTVVEFDLLLIIFKKARGPANIASSMY
jgi:hypothetical protein